MKRLILLFAGLGIVVGVLLMPQAASASLNDFTFREFEGNYYLSRDTDGRAVMRVVESFTAEFPDYDRNKGVIRGIPSTYEDHSVSVKVESLKRNGAAEPIYRQYSSNGQWIVETGDDNYVRGNQTYELTYTLRDVIRDSDTYQELYWDTVGTSSPQSFGYVKGTVHLDDSVRGLFTGETLCYEGGKGATTRCQVDDNGSSVTFSSSGEIAPYHNVTMLMKFSPDGFAPYRTDPWQVLKTFGLPVGSLITALVGLVMALRMRFSRRHEPVGTGTIVPQYLPPQGMSVLEASGIKGREQAAIPAQLIDLAVRHKIRIVEQSAGNKPTYQLQLLSTEGLHPDEEAVLRATTKLTAGGTYTLSSTDYSVGTLLRSARDKATGLDAVERGYRQAPPGGKRSKKIATVFLTLGAMVPFGAVFVVPLLSGGMEEDPAWMALFATPFITWPIMFVGTALMAKTKNPLTSQGVATREYLEGLEMYMKVAEADRLKILQSPGGAERTPIDTNDQQQMIRLYERVLPYAVLFGIEKDWAKTLEVAYGTVDTTPDWYSGTSGVFNAAALGSALSTFTGTAAASFVPPPSTSSGSSGFSSGGGFSGGGGGGGSFGGR